MYWSYLTFTRLLLFYSVEEQGTITQLNNCAFYFQHLVGTLFAPIVCSCADKELFWCELSEQHPHQSIKKHIQCPIIVFFVQIRCRFNAHFSWVENKVVCILGARRDIIQLASQISKNFESTTLILFIGFSRFQLPIHRDTFIHH